MADESRARPQRADARRNRARILAAAESVFAAHGADASTEEVAARAGLAIGTVFRHFPTKRALLEAIMKDLLDDLTAWTADGTDAVPDDGLFAFFARVVEEALRKRTVMELLARTGSAPGVGGSVELLRERVAVLLDAGHRGGAVRADVGVDDVLALLTGACAAVLQAPDGDVRERVLAVVFRGLAPESRPR